MACGMIDECFICDEIEKLDNDLKFITIIEPVLPVEMVFPRMKRRYLVIASQDGSAYKDYMDVYDAFTISDGAGNNLRTRVYWFQQYLVEFRDGQLHTQDSEIGNYVVVVQDDKPYDKTKQNHITVAICQHCQVGIFHLIPVIFDEQNPNLDEVDI